MLFLLTIWIPDCLCLAHTVEIRINSTMQATLAGSGVVTASGEPKPPGPKSLQSLVQKYCVYEGYMELDRTLTDPEKSSVGPKIVGLCDRAL